MFAHRSEATRAKRRSGRLELESAEHRLGYAVTDAEDLDADHSALCIKVEDHAGLHLAEEASTFNGRVPMGAPQ